MRGVAIIVAAALASSSFAQEADGGVQAAKVLKGVVEFPDGGREAVYDGCWLSESKCISVAQERVEQAERIKSLEAQAMSSVSVATVLWCVGGAVALGLAGGVAIGFSVKK